MSKTEPPIDWIYEFMNYQQIEKEKRVMEKMATVMYPYAWGMSSEGISPSSSLEYTQKAFRSVRGMVTI